MHPYKPLQPEDRVIIASLKQLNYSVRSSAGHLRRSSARLLHSDRAAVTWKNGLGAFSLFKQQSCFDAAVVMVNR